MGRIHAAADVEEAPTPAAGPRIHAAADVEEVAEGPKTSQESAALLHGAQGASFGTSDELTGVAAAILDNPWARKLREKLGIWSPGEIPVATTREGKPIARPTDDRPKSALEAYRAGRDSAREDLDQTRQDWGKTALVSEFATAILNPVKVPIKGDGILKTGLRAGLEGAAYAAGSSQADLTKGEAGRFLVDTGLGFAAGGTVGTAAAAGGKLVRKGAEAVVENLERRVLNELAEGGPKSVTQKVRDKLAKAGRAILGEVIEGPDGDTVRKAMQQPKAETGRKILKPIIDEVGGKLDEGYEALRAAGKDIKPAAAAAYYNRIMKRAQDPGNSAAEAKAIEQLADNWRDIVGRHQGAAVDLQRLRKFTTETQEAASAVSSDPSIRSRLALKLSAIASDAMDDMLTRASKGDAKLEAAAKLIRDNNQRMYGLLSVDGALASRVGGEASARSGVVRLAERVSTPAAVLGGAGALSLAVSDTDKAIERGAVGLGLVALARGLPALVRAAERGVTTRAINTVRSMPAPPGATLRQRLTEKLRGATERYRQLDRYGKVAGGLAGRAAVGDEEAP
jgi:hypothetical protein